MYAPQHCAHIADEPMRSPTSLSTLFTPKALSWISLLAALAGCGGGSSAPIATIDPLKVDSSYGVDGAIKLRSPAPAAIALQPDGKLLLTGSRQTAPLPANNYGGAPAREVYVRRLTVDGAVDKSFGNNGEVTFNVKGSDAPGDMKLQSNGRIIVSVYAGETCVINFLSLYAPCVTPAGTYAIRSSNLVALTPEGLIDKTFGTDGIAQTTPSENPQRLSLAVAADQSLSLLWSTGLARAQIYGRGLSMFSKDGGAVPTATTPASPVPCEASGESLLRQRNGQIFSAGGRGYTSYADPSLHPGVCIAKHDPKTGAQTSGAWTKFGGNYSLFELVPTEDDGFAAVGTNCVQKNCQLAIARFGAEGAPLTSYGQQSISSLSVPEYTSLTSSLVLPDGSMVVLANKVVYEANFSNPKTGGLWMRIDRNGAPVKDFGTQGILSTPLSNVVPSKFLPDAQGRWLVVSVDRDPSATTTDNDYVVVQRTAGHSKP